MVVVTTIIGATAIAFLATIWIMGSGNYEQCTVDKMRVSRKS